APSGIGTTTIIRLRNESLSATPARRTCRPRRRRRPARSAGAYQNEHRTIFEPAIAKRITMQSYFHQYLDRQKAALDSIPLESVEQIVEKFREALLSDRQLFMMGNGGNASNASH